MAMSYIGLYREFKSADKESERRTVRRRRLALLTTYSGMPEASESSFDRGDSLEAGIARLIEEDQQDEVTLPRDSMAYFARRLAWLSERQGQLDAEYPDESCVDPRLTPR